MTDAAMTETITIWLGERLLIGSIQVVVLVSLAWLTCRLLRRMPAAAQATLWWLVALKLVLVFAPPVVQVPVLPPDFIRYTGPLFQEGPPALTEAAGARSPSIEQIAQPATVASAFRGKPRPADSIHPVFRALILLWLAALIVQAGRLILAHRHLRGIVARSVPWPGDEMKDLAARVGVRRPPPVRMSEEIDSPQVFGLWSPVVLLPAETMTTLSDKERTMTLCHELMHIRRRDLLFGWVPACAERLFFFHPLARLSAREYVSARESACDAAAVRALGVEAGDYGRMLIRLGVGSARPALSVGGSPFSTTSLKRRLEMLESRRLANLSRRWRWALVVLATVLIPVQLVARTPQAPQVSGPRSQPAPSSVIVSGTVTGAFEKDAALELTDAELQIESEGDVFRVVAEKLKVEQLKTQAEQARGVQEGARAKVEEMLARIAKAQETRAKADADKVKLVEQAARELQARAQQEARQVERQAREVTRAPQLTQQQRLERLLEQLERLAAEQRRLLEEVRRLQQQPRE